MPEVHCDPEVHEAPLASSEEEEAVPQRLPVKPVWQVHDLAVPLARPPSVPPLRQAKQVVPSHV